MAGMGNTSGRHEADGRMSKNPVLELPIGHVMRPEIALPLQHMMNIYTVGNFLGAWRDPHQQKHIERIFDSREQARHAVSICAAWLGVRTPVAPNPVPAWWLHDVPENANKLPIASC
ncbi:MAG TPA: hypothetical protein VFC46_08630 [Humisphaera sp.]|nr:hypothetical protein [Humisphaera sp.]